MREFAGKTAVITGGASGIGRAIAERCAKEGMNIVIADIEENALHKTKAELQAKGATVITIKTDVSKAMDVEKLANKTIETFGEVHLLFNNAGVLKKDTMWKSSLNDWKWVMGVNLWGVIHGVKVFTPLMIKQDTECHIVNTASEDGLIYVPNHGPYGVSKYGIVTISESLHLELMEIGSKVKVSVLCPGLVKTRILDSERNRPIELIETPESISSKANEKTQNLGNVMSDRAMSPENVANMVFKQLKRRSSTL